MNLNFEESKGLSESACTEAAGWVTRLHGPERTPAAEAGFRRWLAEGPENAKAFEFLTDVWETSGRLRRRPLEHVKSWQLPGIRISLSRAALAGCAIAILAVLGTLFYMRSDGVSTGVGEQRTLVLDDGSRVHLNTNTQAAVRYDRHTRLVELKSGEALFEVAKQPERPFIVLAGNRRIKALGTSFVVRRDQDKVAVTLVEGKVAVTPLEKPEASTRVTLVPGERLTVAAHQEPKIDTPELSKLTAWQHGQVDFDATRLADAVAEMNRYSQKRIVIEDPLAAGIPVSGVFVAADTDYFVEALAYNYHLQVRRSSDEIVLIGGE